MQPHFYLDYGRLDEIAEMSDQDFVETYTELTSNYNKARETMESEIKRYIDSMIENCIERSLGKDMLWQSDYDIHPVFSEEADLKLGKKIKLIRNILLSLASDNQF